MLSSSLSGLAQRHPFCKCQYLPANCSFLFFSGESSSMLPSGIHDSASLAQGLVQDDAILGGVKVDLNAVVIAQAARHCAQLRHRAQRRAQERLQLRMHLRDLHACTPHVMLG